jgi:hypothetical protein
MIYAAISTISTVCLNVGPLFPIKVNSRYPAITFAFRRTASVPGRIKLGVLQVFLVGLN